MKFEHICNDGQLIKLGEDLCMTIHYIEYTCELCGKVLFHGDLNWVEKEEMK